MAAALSKEENKGLKMDHRNIVLQRGHHGFPSVFSILLPAFTTSVLNIIMAALYMKAAFLPTFKYYGSLGQEKQNEKELTLFVLFKSREIEMALRGIKYRWSDFRFRNKLVLG